jgi:hypothetical protein
MSTLAEVISLYDTNSRDIPAMLRRAADDIEAGRFGDVSEAAFVLYGQTVEVFGWGPQQDGASTSLLLQAGALRLIKEVEQYGRQT